MADWTVYACLMGAASTQLRLPYQKGWGTSIATPSDSSREGRNVDFCSKSSNISVDNRFILQTLYRYTLSGQCFTYLAFSKPTDLCLENIPLSEIEINKRAPEAG